MQEVSRGALRTMMMRVQRAESLLPTSLPATPSPSFLPVRPAFIRLILPCFDFDSSLMRDAVPLQDLIFPTCLRRDDV